MVIKLVLVKGSFMLVELGDIEVGVLIFGIMLVKFCGSKVEDTIVVVVLGDDEVMALDVAIKCNADVLKIGVMRFFVFWGVSKDW